MKRSETDTILGGQKGASLLEANYQPALPKKFTRTRMRSTNSTSFTYQDSENTTCAPVGPLRFPGDPASLASYNDVGLNTYSVGSRVGKPPRTRLTAARVAKATAWATSCSTVQQPTRFLCSRWATSWTFTTATSRAPTRANSKPSNDRAM